MYYEKYNATKDYFLYEIIVHFGILLVNFA